MPMRARPPAKEDQTESTYPRRIGALAHQPSGQRPADVSHSPECLRYGSPPSPLPRLRHLDDHDGRHGEHARGPDALDHARPDQHVHGRAPGRGAGARQEQQQTRDVHGLATRGVGYVREDELEDGLRQQVARCQGEDLDLGRVSVFGDFL